MIAQKAQEKTKRPNLSPDWFVCDVPDGFWQHLS